MSRRKCLNTFHIFIFKTRFENIWWVNSLGFCYRSSEAPRDLSRSTSDAMVFLFPSKIAQRKFNWLQFINVGVQSPFGAMNSVASSRVKLWKQKYEHKIQRHTSTRDKNNDFFFHDRKFSDARPSRFLINAQGSTWQLDQKKTIERNRTEYLMKDKTNQWTNMLGEFIYIYIQVRQKRFEEHLKSLNYFWIIEEKAAELSRAFDGTFWQRLEKSIVVYFCKSLLIKADKADK